MLKSFWYISLIFLLQTSCTSAPKGQSQTAPKGQDEAAPKTQNVLPPLDSQLQRDVQIKLDVRSPGLGRLSPDNKTLYFSWGITGSRQIYKLSNPMAFPQQLTGGEDQTALEDITPDGRWLILSRDFNGEENPGLYLQNPQGGALRRIQHLPKVVTHYEFTSQDSKHIFFRSNQLDSSSFGLWRYEVNTSKVENIFNEKGTWTISDHKGNNLILSKILSNTASEHYLWNLKDRKLIPILGQNEKENYTVQFGTRSGQYLVSTNKFSDFFKVYWYEKLNFKEISPNQSMDITGSIDPDRKKVFFTFNDNGYTRVRVFNANTLQPLIFPGFKNADHVLLGSLSKDGNTIMVGVDTGASPRIDYSYNFVTKKLSQWTLPSSPESDLTRFSKPELITIPTRDGQSITAWLRKPLNPASAFANPIVVHFHGGPEAQSRPGFSVFAQMFLDAGFIFVEPNVRGSTGFGKKFLDADNGPKRLDVITDIEDVSVYLKEKFAVNSIPPKIGVMGWSYGGYSTLMAMSRFAGSYDAGVSLVGMSNLVTFLNNTAPYRRHLRTPEYGDPVTDLEALIKLSPMTYLNQIKSPLLIIQGANDPRVPASESQQIFDALKNKSIPSALLIFEDEGHGSQKRSNRVLELGHTIQWFKKYLN